MTFEEATVNMQRSAQPSGISTDKEEAQNAESLGGDCSALEGTDYSGTYIPNCPKLLIERKWAMPNSYTFKINVVDALLKQEMTAGPWCDPFAGMYSPAEVTNDLNPKARAMFHVDALEFLKAQPTAHYAGVLYDPPYSQRQVRECYDQIGINRWDGRMTFWSDTKNESARIIKPGGKAICFGWNSMGLGKGRGFEMRRILLVAHGGSRNDTICTVESNNVSPIQ